MKIYKELPNSRLAYLDNFRSLIIFLVVAMHSAVTYSGIGDWYYKEGSEENLSVIELIAFAFFQSNLQAWSMGALFFISAYLATKALARRTSFEFIKERVIRLGIPLLIYIFIISPLIHFIIFDWGTGSTITEKYLNYLVSFEWIGATGPLWFVQMLLLFCIIYAILKKYIIVKNYMSAFDAKNIIFTIFITGTIAFLIRIIFPIGSSFYNLQFSYFSSYIVLFVLGIIIGENNLFEYISGEQNIKWLKLTLITGPIIWTAIMLFGGALEGNYYFEGGLYWQNAVYALWESFKAIGFTMGLIAFFKKYINIKNKFTSLISKNSFGIYVFHAPLLIIVSLLLKPWITFPLLKFVTVTIITFFICLAFSFIIRKIKPVGFIFK
jgi:surface polysaccharide O-acyltransferase-like enzyme